MLSTTLCGMKLRNPTILASGILGVTKESAAKVGRMGAGAVTLKSLCHEERKGNPNPTMFGRKGQFLNAVGLPGQGIDNAIDDFKKLNDLDVPVIGSIFGYTIEQFGEVAKKMASLKPAMIEVDISCPHMEYSKPFYADEDSIEKITKMVKKNSGKIPVSIKLSPNVHNIADLARAAEKAGADCITAINTASAMKINIETGKPILANRIGGLSGPALRPIAVRCVYEIYEKVKIPIIGTGGVTTGEDAIEMIMAGAAAVGVGTAFYYNGLEAMKKITSEMEAWMKKHKVKTLSEIRGKAHE
ncbi:dihydroorotate dehydrogenase [Candidatus Woesearchaeota archaeon]|nr:dihydroorotate dehydrogenase [Candidatus Woesearchaeota archaeon]